MEASEVIAVHTSMLSLPMDFARRAGPDGALPPLARMVGETGKAGMPVIGMYLTTCWRQRPSVEWALCDYTHHDLACMLNLASAGVPTDGGESRIRTALRWLEAHDMIERDGKIRGRPPRIRAKAADGSGGPFVPGVDAGRSPVYLSLPPHLWWRLWIGSMSAASLAMLIVVIAESNPLLGRWEPAQVEKPRKMWLPETKISRSYCIGEKAARKGLDELQELGIVEVVRRKPTLGERAQFSANSSRNRSPDPFPQREVIFSPKVLLAEFPPLADDAKEGAHRLAGARTTEVDRGRRRRDGARRSRQAKHRSAPGASQPSTHGRG